MQLNYKGKTVNFLNPIDISIPLSNTELNPIAWYLDLPSIEPEKTDNWVGKVSLGSSTNFNKINFNPHGHGTHTECLGHITYDFYSINSCLKHYFFEAILISISPEKNCDDWVITSELLEKALQNNKSEAIIIRTLPNLEKKNKQTIHIQTHLI